MDNNDSNIDYSHLMYDENGNKNTCSKIICSKVKQLNTEMLSTEEFNKRFGNLDGIYDKLKVGDVVEVKKVNKKKIRASDNYKMLMKCKYRDEIGIVRDLLSESEKYQYKKYMIVYKVAFLITKLLAVATLFFFLLSIGLKILNPNFFDDTIIAGLLISSVGLLFSLVASCTDNVRRFDKLSKGYLMRYANLSNEGRIIK